MGAGVPFVLLYLHLSVNRNLYMKLMSSKKLFRVELLLCVHKRGYSSVVNKLVIELSNWIQEKKPVFLSIGYS